MVPLYTLFLTFLGGLKWLLHGRASRVERQFARAALGAEQAARASQTRPGNAAAADPLATAKRQYELGRLVEARDALESKYLGWQSAADRAGRFLARLKGWNGRTVPYLFGVVDAGLVLAALSFVGVFTGFDLTAVREWLASVNW